MKITNIEKKSGTRYTVDVDDEYFYIFDVEILQNNHLKVGVEVDEDFLLDLRTQAEERKARERAFYLLSYRDHSERELYDKLRKNASDEISAKIVAKMVGLHLLNDEVYAGKLARFYLEQKHWSFRKAMFEMKRRGIDRELAEQSLGECEVDPLEQMATLIEHNYYRYLGDPKGNQKVTNALARLGFNYGDIKTAITQYEREEEEEDQWQYE